MITAADIAAARQALADELPPTLCRPTRLAEGWFAGPLYLKMENLQPTGSFKDRGACWRLAGLTPAERRRGVITASAGNHAQAVAREARRLELAATVVMPLATPLIKVASTRELGATIHLHGQSFDDAYAEAERLAREREQVFIPPFDDDRIIAGQGTCGLEILDQVPEVGQVVVPVGGGGLIAGVATALKAARPACRIVGVEAAAYPSMGVSLAAGAVTPAGGAPTLADGIAVKRVCPRTLEYVQRLVDELVTVEEETIARAILLLLERRKTVAEGAAAATLAALLEGRVKPVAGPTVLLISGGNIDVSRLDDIIVRGLAADGRRVRLRVVMPDRPGQLHRLTGLIAELGVNVLHVVHDREFGPATLGRTMTTLTLETRGEEQVAELLNRLAGAGFDGVERVPAATRTGGVAAVPGY